MSRFIKKSQFGPMMPPSAPVQPEKEKDIIIPGPLDSVEKILIDSRIKYRLADVNKVEDIALQIWEEYGGKRNGGVYSNRTGKRTENDKYRTLEEVMKERKLNENRKWERLSVDENFNTINKVTSLEEMSDAIRKIMFSHIKKLKSENKGGGGPTGGMPF